MKKLKLLHIRHFSGWILQTGPSNSFCLNGVCNAAHGHCCWWLPAKALYFFLEQRHWKEETTDRQRRELIKQSRWSVKLEAVIKHQIHRRYIWLKFRFSDKMREFWSATGRSQTDRTNAAHQASSQAAVKVTKRKTHYLVLIREPNDFTAAFCGVDVLFFKTLQKTLLRPSQDAQRTPAIWSPLKQKTR